MDFSMTGMKLRLSDADIFQLQIFVPYDDLREYGKQIPLTVDARVVWTSQEGDYVIHGIEYVDLDSNAAQSIKKCICYFHDID